MQVFIALSLAIFLAFSVSAQKFEVSVQQGHSGAIYAVDVSSDGELLASGSRDRTIRL